VLLRLDDLLLVLAQGPIVAAQHVAALQVQAEALGEDAGGERAEHDHRERQRLQDPPRARLIAHEPV